MYLLVIQQNTIARYNGRKLLGVYEIDLNEVIKQMVEAIRLGNFDEE